MSIQVYKAINAVQLELSTIGITKDRKNAQQGYQFRGIDDIYNVVSPLLAKNGLCILPRMLSRVVTERTTSKGGVLIYVTVEAEFDFVASEDGSMHTIKTYGEAMDSADKATNKAMSAAYKYACLQAFAIPTEGDNDSDQTTHEVLPKKTAAQELIELCAKEKINVKAFVHYFGISSSDLDKIKQAVADFSKMVDVFKKATQEGTVSAA
jgi:hypothetical protein